MTALHTFVAFLLLNGAAPSGATADCPPDDNGCKAKRSELRAASAQTPDQRATYLRSAHRSYLFLFDKTGDVLDLCSARRTFDASIAVKDQSADERTRTQVLRDDLIARERKAGASCKGVAKPRRASRADEPPVVASVPESKAPAVDATVDAAELTSDPPPLMTNTATPEPLPAPHSTLAASGPPAPAAGGPAAPAASGPAAPPVRRQRLDETLMPIPTRRKPLRLGTDKPRPGRGLVIAGGLTLGVGVALTAAAGHMGRRMTETKQEYFALHDMVGGFATTEQDAAGGALLRDYQGLWTQRLALACAGGTTIVLAAVLAGVGGRRLARAASRTALVPVPGGLALHTRF